MASALEQFVNNVRSLSASGNIRELYQMVSKSEELLVRNSAHLSTVLETLDVQQHSLGVLAALLAQCPQAQLLPDAERAVIIDKIQDFINNCNGEHVRHANDMYANLCHRLTEYLVEAKQPTRGILLLKKAIRKIQLLDSQLTSVHADLCQLCLLAKNMKPALEFLDTDVTAISSELGGNNDSKHFLLYYYYGGMIYLALKNYDRALYFFEVVITVPSVVVSHIMLEAYKKFLLTSLILNGKMISNPKYSSLVVSRFLKPLTSAYHELTSPAQAAARHRDTFVADNNMGLVHQAINKLYKKNIQRLTKTFLTLSLSDVASRVQLSGPAQAEFYIRQMIEDGEIYAVIDQKDGMVVFQDSPETFASASTLELLERQMAACTRLHKHIHELDEQIQTNPQYVKKLMGSHDEDMPGPVMSSSSQNTKTTYTM